MPEQTSIDQLLHAADTEWLLDEVRLAVNGVGDPCSVATGTPMGLVDMGLLEHAEITGDGDLVVQLRLTSPSCYQIGYFTHEIKQRCGEIDGVRSVEVRADAGLVWTPSMMSDDAKRRRRESLARKGIRPLIGG